MLYILLAILIYFIHLYLKSKHSIWRKRGVSGPEPIPIFGNFAAITFTLETFPDFIWKIYKQYPEEKVVGLYQGYQPILLLKDPEIIKQILIKDFQIFRNRGLTPSRGKINENLFVVKDDTWKVLRQNLTPVFTSKKIKGMCPSIQKCAENYVDAVLKLTHKQSEQEMKQLSEKYAIQATTSCVFSVDTNPFSSDDNEFNYITKNVLKITTSSKISFFLESLFPGIRKYIYTNRKAEKALINLLNNIIEQKKQISQKSNDVLDLIITLINQEKLNNRGENGVFEVEVDKELLLAQATIFYFAGVEPTSWLISYIFHELSLNQNIQNRLYGEICKVSTKYKGKLTYDAINEMTYLDMVVNETLRKYPIATTIFRKCEADYQIPGTKTVIPKGASILVSIGALQNDPKFIKNPEIFNPENFAPENKNNILRDIDMSFGDGPRNCIGMRFAIIMTKIGVAEFVKTFKLSPSPKTKLEFNIEDYSLLYSSKDGVWLHAKRR